MATSYGATDEAAEEVAASPSRAPLVCVSALSLSLFGLVGAAVLAGTPRAPVALGAPSALASRDFGGWDCSATLAADMPAVDSCAAADRNMCSEMGCFDSQTWCGYLCSESCEQGTGALCLYDALGSLPQTCDALDAADASRAPASGDWGDLNVADIPVPATASCDMYAYCAGCAATATCPSLLPKMETGKRLAREAASLVNMLPQLCDRLEGGRAEPRDLDRFRMEATLLEMKALFNGNDTATQSVDYSQCSASSDDYAAVVASHPAARVCAPSAADDDFLWFRPCQWQAVAHMPDVCAGTFAPEAPSARDGPFALNASDADVCSKLYKSYYLFDDAFEVDAADCDPCQVDAFLGACGTDNAYCDAFLRYNPRLVRSATFMDVPDSFFGQLGYWCDAAVLRAIDAGTYAPP